VKQKQQNENRRRRLKQEIERQLLPEFFFHETADPYEESFCGRHVRDRPRFVSVFSEARRRDIFFNHVCHRILSRGYLCDKWGMADLNEF
jgi:hypothetical protein